MILTLISDLGFAIQCGSANSRECSLGSIMQTPKISSVYVVLLGPGEWI